MNNFLNTLVHFSIYHQNQISRAYSGIIIICFSLSIDVSSELSQISPTTTYPGQSSSSPWIRVNNKEAIATAYIRNPATICKKTKSYEAKPTFGHDLYIQTKSWLTKGGKKAFKISSSGLKNTAWVKGRCFPKMGVF